MGLEGIDPGTDPPDMSGGRYTREGLALAAATGSALGLGATVTGLGIPVMFLGQILGAVAGAALIGGTSYDSAIGGTVAVVVVALGVGAGLVVPGALSSGDPTATVGTAQYVPYTLAGIPIVLPGALVLEWIRSRATAPVGG